MKTISSWTMKEEYREAKKDIRKYHKGIPLGGFEIIASETGFTLSIKYVLPGKSEINLYNVAI